MISEQKKISIHAHSAPDFSKGNHARTGETIIFFQRLTLCTEETIKQKTPILLPKVLIPFYKEMHFVRQSPYFKGAKPVWKTMAFFQRCTYSPFYKGSLAGWQHIFSKP